MRILSVLILFVFMVAPPVLAGNEASNLPKVFMDTSGGKIILELYSQKAPETVNNFLTYVKSGFYDGELAAIRRIYRDARRVGDVK